MKKLVIKPKNPKGEDGYKIFSIRVKEETVAHIGEVSGKTGRRLMQIVLSQEPLLISHCYIQS